VKNRVAVGIAIIIAGGLIALGPQYIFKICDQTHHDITKCFWTARAEIGVGGTIAAIGAAYLLFGELFIRAGLTVALVLEGIHALLIPNLLIGVCDHANMACRVATLPALGVIGVGTALLAGANLFYLFRISRKKIAGDA
jgi:hypothetical protein